MTRRELDHTAPRRPHRDRPRHDALTEEANLVRDAWEKLLRIRPL
jgi:hypothetical protein